MRFFEVLKAIFLGIVEGITEWLPVSSTGHMILFDEFIKLDVSEEFKEMFFVVIQLGAILAVPTLFWNRLWPFGKTRAAEQRTNVIKLWIKVIIGAVPAAVLGFLLDDFLDAHLYTPWVVSIALIVYGIAFILYLTGVWTPSLIGIALLFGIGNAFDSVVSLGAFAFLLKREKINISILLIRYN